MVPRGVLGRPNFWNSGGLPLDSGDPIIIRDPCALDWGRRRWNLLRSSEGEALAIGFALSHRGRGTYGLELWRTLGFTLPAFAFSGASLDCDFGRLYRHFLAKTWEFHEWTIMDH